ncbi:glucokinase [Sphingomonas daechungensis]|uniref:Glucokinase n=1 Tax=Sphingomonas daechungensis TaxID=1176646 RepID=A0ABX6T154_9SPHN|nr:glucokinase [Sphingomonas daechungensis]QNP42642.1 glucokinase [Sphingomonas daechungensis]
MKTIAAADVGGTHARFALASIDDGRVVHLGEPVTVKTSEFASFQHAWQEFGRRIDQPLPNELSIAFAGPVGGEVLKLTNNPWVIRPALMHERLGVERFVIVNDFAAIAYAVAGLDGSAYRHICGPEADLPTTGVISIVGPGTGLGVASLLKRADGYDVIATEGGHIDFAPLDPLEDKILDHLRANYRRVSVERLVSGRGLLNIYEALGTIEKRPYTLRDEKDLWTAALAGTDTLAAAALDRLCLAFGAAAGDYALAQGAHAVVLAGGLGLRLVDFLPRSGFRDRFIAKGRFERMMDEMPVKVIVHPQPGLFGAAEAFASNHGVIESER